MESGLYSYKFLKSQLSVALGGRVAEELAVGREDVTTGASNDLQQVRDLARRMIAQWGFLADEANRGNGNALRAPVAWETPDGGGHDGTVDRRGDEEVSAAGLRPLLRDVECEQGAHAGARGPVGGQGDGRRRRVPADGVGAHVVREVPRRRGDRVDSLFPFV